MFAVSLIFLEEKWSIPQAWDVQLQESEKQGKYLEKKKKRFIIFKKVEAGKKMILVQHTYFLQLRLKFHFPSVSTDTVKISDNA